MAFGVTLEGFNPKRLPDIKLSLEELNKAAFGDIRTDPDSNFGQKIGVESEVLSLLWELEQNIYNSQYPSTAEGVSLDYVLELNGLKRLGATSTDVTVGLEVSDTTVIPDDLRAVVNTSGEEFQIQDGFTVDYSNLFGLYYEVDDVQNSTAYDVIINAVTTSITSIASGSTAISIATQIVDALNLRADVTATQPSSGVVLVSGVSNLAFADTTVDSKLLLRIPRTFLSINKGQILATSGSVDTVSSTPVSGLTSVYNYEEGLLGREIQTDAEARVYREESLASLGNATIEAIRTKLLLNVENLNSVSVIENDTDATVDSQPPHSIAVIASGGFDGLELATEIFNTKAAGIATYGSDSEVITDSQGFTHVINYSEPSTVPIYVGINITTSTEESFPVDGEQQIKDALVAFALNYNSGDDVVYQKLFTPIYSIQGIADAELGIKTSGAYSDPPTILPSEQANIPISITEIASIIDANIVIEVF